MKLFTWILACGGALISGGAIAQNTNATAPDYVITARGDTLRGRILHLGKSSLNIAPLSGTPFTRLEAGEVAEVSFNGQLYWPALNMPGSDKLIIAGERDCLMGKFARLQIRRTAAPRDYVITLNGDTVKGLITRFGLASLKIDPVTAAAEMSYDAKELLEVAYKGVIYRPVESLSTARSPIFAERLLHGKVDLFVTAIPAYRHAMVSYYAATGDGVPKEVFNNETWPKGFRSAGKRRDNLQAVFDADSTLLHALTGDKNYTFEDVYKLVLKYNSGS